MPGRRSADRCPCRRVSVELLPEITRRALVGDVVIGFALGIATMLVADKVIDRIRGDDDDDDNGDNLAATDAREQVPAVSVSPATRVTVSASLFVPGCHRLPAHRLGARLARLRDCGTRRHGAGRALGRHDGNRPLLRCRSAAVPRDQRAPSRGARGARVSVCDGNVFRRLPHLPHRRHDARLMSRLPTVRS